MQRLLTSREVDLLLRYPRGRSVKLAKRGLLQAVYLPDGEVRFREDVIYRWLEQQTAPANSTNQGHADAT